MTLFEFFTLLGGVGLFLYGMSLMSQGLKLAAGNKLRSILEHATANRFVAVAVGVLVTLLVQNLTPGDVGHQVANTHTIFAILAVLIEFPFANQIVALSKKVIPVRADESRSVEDRKLIYLVQTRGLPSSLAIQQAKLELLRMGGLAREGLDTAIRCFFTQNDRLAESVAEIEETIDILTDKIQEALISLRSNEYPPDDANRLSQLLLTASDMNLHPHAVLNRVLWRWYQSPSGFKPLRVF